MLRATGDVAMPLLKLAVGALESAGMVTHRDIAHGASWLRGRIEVVVGHVRLAGVVRVVAPAVVGHDLHPPFTLEPWRSSEADGEPVQPGHLRELVVPTLGASGVRRGESGLRVYAGHARHATGGLVG